MWCWWGWRVVEVDERGVGMDGWEWREEDEQTSSIIQSVNEGPPWQEVKGEKEDEDEEEDEVEEEEPIVAI